METFILVTGAALIFAGIVVYYKTVGNGKKRKSDFRDDGQLHMIYPK